MREIKFRVWDDTDKKWLLGYEYPNLRGFSMMGETMLFGEYSKMLESFDLTDWDRIKIMQFTGLLDKNGKEIFEGDIVSIRCWHNNPPSKRPKIAFIDKLVPIVFKDGKFMPDMCTGGSDDYGTTYGEWNDTEVIGNIYELNKPQP